DPSTGDLFQLNVSPSGAFDPLIDSYGRIVFTRWDHLQRDPNADKDAVGLTNYGTFNYSDESASTVVTNSRDEIYPEPEPTRRDLLKGTNLNGLIFNQFFPWQINEDGTSEETLNHAGRHDLLPAFKASINDDPNVTDFNYQTSGRLNDSTLLQNLIQLSEDPTNPGTYYGVNFLGFDQHSSAQLVTLTASPRLDPSKMAFSYITDKSTVTAPSEGTPPDPNSSGHYRNPLPLSNGKLLAVHAPETHGDRNIGSQSHPISRYDFRIKTMKKAGAMWVADSAITPGISKTVSYWDPDTLVTYSGALWELDPVEVRPRQIPQKRSSTLAQPEHQVFVEEGVDELIFRNYLKQNDLAMLVSRNITHRDNSDHQQPYFLKVHNSETESANAHGKIYDVAHIELYQADQLRGMTLGNPTPIPGRRVLAEFMHDTAVTFNPPLAGEKQNSVKIAPDGSFAAFVPTRRAITWELTDSTFIPVVRERYWVTTQPGEIRVCASCHGTNDDALLHVDPPPQNKPEALRAILKFWKSSHAPLSVDLIAPPTDSTNITLSVSLLWHSAANAKKYIVTISSKEDFTDIVFTSPELSDTSYIFESNKSNTTFYWRVQAIDESGASAFSGVWKFTTAAASSVSEKSMRQVSPISIHPNPSGSLSSIGFDLARSGEITLSIYSVLGQEVATIAQGWYGSGKHSILWDASMLPSGTYYCRLHSREGILTSALRILR
ncbi:MAG: hypothetical protein Q8896_03140, partial [Bacteroidota bacterium]|nr:hypothetical protein [Bacteroidota bacterium]